MRFRLPRLVLAGAIGIALTNPGKRAAGEGWTARDQPDLKALYAQAPNLTVETLCAPVKTITPGGHYLVPNPDGQSYDLLQIYFKQYGGPNAIAILDLGAGTAKVFDPGPDYANFHLAPHVIAPNGKLFLSILGNRHQDVCVYDPATGEFRMNAVAMPTDILGETHPMVLGPDGMIYCSGAHPSGAATAVQINPDTLAVKSYGAIGPSHAPHPCWAYSMGVDDRFTYIASGKTPWYLVAHDRETGRAEVLLTNDRPDGYIGVNQNRGGASGFSRVRNADGSHTDSRYWLWQGQAIPMEGDRPTPPWPEPPAEPTPPPVPELSFTAASPDETGTAVIWVRTAADRAAAPQGHTPAPNVKPGEDDAPPPPPSPAEMREAGWRDFALQIPTFPLRIDRLMELPDGRLFGTAGHYQGNFYFDPATDTCLHPGRCGLSHYATVITDNRIYMSGYPNGPLLELDPAKPWTAGKPIDAARVVRQTDPDSNPRQLTTFVQAGAKKMMAGAAGSGKIYFGGTWMREGNWGGLGWWDPAAGTAHGIWEPFLNHQIRYMAAADEGRVLVLSTLKVHNHVRNLPEPASAALMFFDTVTDQLLAETLVPVPGARGTGPVVAVGGERVLGWTENPADPKGSSILYGVDAVARRVLFTQTIPYPISLDVGGHQWDLSDFRLGPDGKVWTFIQWKLARIDPADASIAFLGSTGDGGRLAFAGTDVYLGGREEIRRVRGLLPPE